MIRSFWEVHFNITWYVPAPLVRLMTFGCLDIEDTWIKPSITVTSHSVMTLQWTEVQQLVRLKTKKTSKLRITAPLIWWDFLTGLFMRKGFPCYDVVMTQSLRYSIAYLVNKYPIMLSGVMTTNPCFAAILHMADVQDNRSVGIVTVIFLTVECKCVKSICEWCINRPNNIIIYTLPRGMHDVRYVDEFHWSFF